MNLTKNYTAIELEEQSEFFVVIVFQRAENPEYHDYLGTGL